RKSAAQADRESARRPLRAGSRPHGRHGDAHARSCGCFFHPEHNIYEFGFKAAAVLMRRVIFFR
ncbi:MAG: hypothetical protein ACM3SW_18255, partial [Actinomycetota bacterium]